MAYGGWDGANTSERRGQIVWHTLDTRKELGRNQRREILRRARWADANVGLVRRMIQGVANLVGYLTPQACTGNADYDTAVERAFESRTGFAAAFDMASKLDFRAWQIATTRCRLRDGDALTVVTEGSTGGLRVVFYEAHQIDDGTQDLSVKPKNLQDGCYVDAFGRHTAYRIVNPDDPSKFSTVLSQDSIFHADWERPGRVRGVSGVAHAINNSTDIIEILADTKHAIKIAALWGVMYEQPVQQAANSGGAKELAEFLGAKTVGTTGAQKEILLDNVMHGGRIQSVEGKVTTLQDARPHPNQMALVAYLVRDMAWGLGLGPEILWDLGGITGPGTRYMMAETQRWVQSQQRILRNDCHEIWFRTLAKEMAAGRLERPAPGVEWWKAKWLPQADMTIDSGREGMLEIARLEAAITTESEIYGRRGLDWEDAKRQRAKEIKRSIEIAEEMGIDPAWLLGSKTVSAAAPTEE